MVRNPLLYYTFAFPGRCLMKDQVLNISKITVQYIYELDQLLNSWLDFTDLDTPEIINFDSSLLA